MKHLKYLLTIIFFVGLCLTNNKVNAQMGDEYGWSQGGSSYGGGWDNINDVINDILENGVANFDDGYTHIEFGDNGIIESYNNYSWEEIQEDPSLVPDYIWDYAEEIQDQIGTVTDEWMEAWTAWQNLGNDPNQVQQYLTAYFAQYGYSFTVIGGMVAVFDLQNPTTNNGPNYFIHMGDPIPIPILQVYYGNNNYGNPDPIPNTFPELDYLSMPDIPFDPDDPDWLEWLYNYQINYTPLCNNPAFVATTATVVSGYVPSISLGSNYGLTYPEAITVDITACHQGSNWITIMTGLQAHYSQQLSMQGAMEVTGPTGNTTSANFCNQVTDLKSLAPGPVTWYMFSSIQAHEDVHSSHFQPSIETASSSIEFYIEGLSVPYTGQTQAEAITQIRALTNFGLAISSGYSAWLSDATALVLHDHDTGGLCETAEHSVVDPMIATICAHAATQSWSFCAACH